MKKRRRSKKPTAKPPIHRNNDIRRLSNWAINSLLLCTKHEQYYADRNETISHWRYHSLFLLLVKKLSGCFVLASSASRNNRYRKVLNGTKLIWLTYLSPISDQFLINSVQYRSILFKTDHDQEVIFGYQSILPNYYRHLFQVPIDIFDYRSQVKNETFAHACKVQLAHLSI